jgi:hypothetical protein
LTNIRLVRSSACSFGGEDVFQQSARRRVAIADEQDHLPIRFDGDPFRDEVLLHHAAQRMALRILGVTSLGEPVRVEIGRATELNAAMNCSLYAAGSAAAWATAWSCSAVVRSLRHVEVTLQRRTQTISTPMPVQQVDDGAAVRVIVGCDGAALDVLSSARAGLRRTGRSDRPRLWLLNIRLVIHAYPRHALPSQGSRQRSPS